MLYNYRQQRRCDGIGRRSGLKIHRQRWRTGSSPVTGTKMNDPTQFEQVDETCEFGGAVLYSESLGITAFFENAVPSKYETQKLKQLQFGIENEKIRQFEHECLIRLFQWSFLPPGKALDFSVCDEAFGCYKTQYRKRHLLEICQNASFLSTPDRTTPEIRGFLVFSFAFATF